MGPDKDGDITYQFFCYQNKLGKINLFPIKIDLGSEKKKKR